MPGFSANGEVSEEDLIGDGRLLKRIVSRGRGASPVLGSQLRVHYESSLAASGVVFDSSLERDEPFDFVLGDSSVLEAWNVGVPTMLPGETSEFVADASLAYGQEGASSVPPGAALRFRITLLPDAATAEASEASLRSEGAQEDGDRERLRRAGDAKERGNALVKAGREGEARDVYMEALAELSGLRTGEIAALRERNGLRLSCLLNLALCELKLEDFAAAARRASEALEIEPGSGKALYRRGVARVSCGLLSDGRADLLEACRLDPQNSEIRQRLAECREKLAQSEAWSRAAFGGIFGKAPEQHVVTRDFSRLPIVWMDVQIGGEPPERLRIVLYSDTAPRTAENFRALCTGARGVGRCGQPLHYRHTLVHRIVAGSLLEAGDIENYDGSGGESIYGPTFQDESFKDLHHKRGLLSMANRGPGTNNSKFFVTLRSLPQFDGKHVVFGEVVGGSSVLERIEKVETRYPDRPVTQVAIVACGEGEQ